MDWCHIPSQSVSTLLLWAPASPTVVSHCSDCVLAPVAVRGSLPISKLQVVLVGKFGVLDPAGQRVAAVLKQFCSKICICFSVILPLIHWLYTCHTSLKPWNVIIHGCWNVHLMHAGPSERSSRLGLTSQHLGIGRSCIIKLFNHAVFEVHLSQTHLKHVTITGQTGQTARLENTSAVWQHLTLLAERVPRHQSSGHKSCRWRSAVVQGSAGWTSTQHALCKAG